MKEAYIWVLDKLIAILEGIRPEEDPLANVYELPVKRDYVSPPPHEGVDKLLVSTGLVTLCEYCGKETTTPPRRIGGTMSYTCSTECATLLEDRRWELEPH